MDVFHNGRFLLHVAVQSMVYDYKLSHDCRRIVIHWGFLMVPTRKLELYNLLTGMKIGKIATDAETGELPEDAPAWARTYFKSAAF